MTKKEVMKLKKGSLIVYKGEVHFFYSFNGITTWIDRVTTNHLSRIPCIACDYRDLEHLTELLKALV